MMWRWVLLFTLALLPLVNAQSVENYYCNEDNCYDLLELTREASKADIKKAFRRIAGKTHPDRFQDPDEKAAAEVQFKKVATAYDILRDDDARSDYDYMLDHPDEFYMNYYKAWRRRNYPNVDVRIVIAVAISLISGVQYYNGWSKFNEAITYFSTTPKYRNHALEIARTEGLLDNHPDKKRPKGVSKQQLKEQEEKVIRQVIENKMDIRGVYARPSMYDILWVQLVMFPLWTGRYLTWYASWCWRFWILKQAYGVEEKLYIIRRNMKMSQGQFDSLEEKQHKDFLKQELWLPEKFKVWKEERDHEMRVKQAQSGKYKIYKRYLKNNGPGRMYFDD